MKELMCTHLAKRGSTYYYRRKTPLDLIHIFGKEVMKSLGTKDRKEAEIIVRKVGSDYDELFFKARIEAADSTIAHAPSSSPAPEQIKPPRFDDALRLMTQKFTPLEVGVIHGVRGKRTYPAHLSVAD